MPRCLDEADKGVSWHLTLPLARSSSSNALLAAGVLTFVVDPCGQYRKIRSYVYVCVSVYILERVRVMHLRLEVKN